MRPLRTLVFCIAFFGVAGAAFAQKVETGFLNRIVVLDGVEYRYQVYVPREFDASKAWPVILALHGGGEYGDDGLKQTEGALGSAIRHNADRFPAIVVFPQAKLDLTPGWQLRGGEAALASLDKAIREFHGDPDRVYLTGYSAGGNGTWFLATHHPERFAAVVPICAFVSKFHGHTSNTEYPALAPATEADPYLSLAKKVAHLPIWVFHGDADPTVPVTESRNMVKALQSLGGNVKYTELPGVGHNAWDAAYGNAEMISWLFQQRRRSK